MMKKNQEIQKLKNIVEKGHFLHHTSYKVLVLRPQLRFDIRSCEEGKNRLLNDLNHHLSRSGIEVKASSDAVRFKIHKQCRKKHKTSLLKFMINGGKSDLNILKDNTSVL